MRATSVRFAVWMLVAAARAGQAFVLGGGDASKDCRVAFGGVDATLDASGVVCVDGDPSCDRDGLADGVCRVDVAVCIDVAVEPCTRAVVDRVDVAGAPLDVPALPAAAGSCGTSAPLEVPVGAPSATTLLAREGAELRDVDYLQLCCVSAPDAFDGARCAVGVDPAAAGCTRVPRRVRSAFTRARATLPTGLDTSDGARRRLLRARRLMSRVHATASRTAKRRDCGFALQLMATYASGRLEDAIEATAPAQR